jgi:integrase
VSPLVATYVNEALAANSKRAYGTDWDHFARWGGAVPAAAEQVASYLAEHAGSLSVATLQRRLVTIAKKHREQGAPDPVAHPLVKATLRGIKRVHGVKQRQATPLNLEDLIAALQDLGSTPSELRDRALLLLGFAAALRRSELVSLNAEDITPVQTGLHVHIRRSKTDPFGAGRVVKLGTAEIETKAIQALQCWVQAAGISSGPAFRRIDRDGRIGEGRLSGEAVALILRKRLSTPDQKATQLTPHSLRAGYVTHNALLDMPLWRIKLTTGHKSDVSVQRYIRAT